VSAHIPDSNTFLLCRLVATNLRSSHDDDADAEADEEDDDEMEDDDNGGDDANVDVDRTTENSFRISVSSDEDTNG
jgi:hypothetical protein